MDSNNNNNMVEICDICGHVGYVEVLVTCSLCKLACEHIYCMSVYLKNVPERWVCESCACVLRETNFSDMVYEDMAPLDCEPNIIILDEFEETDTKRTNVASVLEQQHHPASIESQGNHDDFVYPNTTNDMTRAERRVRGASRGVRLNKTTATMGRIKVTWTPTQGKPIGDMASLFNGEIGVLVRKFIPLKYEKQKDIPNELYDILTEQLLNQFDVDISQPHIKRYIYYEIGNRFKDYRWTLYKHYQKYADPVEARRNPYKYTTTDDWNILCDRWESSSWKEKSARNKVSRSKIRFNHCGGSKSFLSRRVDKGKEDGTYISLIEVFYETHCSASKGWVDQAAKEAYLWFLERGHHT
ncbi:uncharacterized protein LOC120083572 isoform X2 [Benincasa hispida]|uniref:uncharacterized protein LOC120083572 isoform X2 n=1 Tax=Benincasa hispida TaxID=102211 RepID=UPI001900BB76|nr:uncharacterized protein LOC120083572 isoform X2 [Benincasa hispida]